jgi:hypothetical protein
MISKLINDLKRVKPRASHTARGFNSPNNEILALAKSPLTSACGSFPNWKNYATSLPLTQMKSIKIAIFIIRDTRSSTIHPFHRQPASELYQE